MAPGSPRRRKGGSARGGGEKAKEVGSRGATAPPGAQPPSLLWSEKHRPRTLDDIVGQEAAVGLLKRVAVEGDLPHLVLYGPPGTGKRSAALAFARALFGEGGEGCVSFVDLPVPGSEKKWLEKWLARVDGEACQRPLRRPFRLMVLDGCEALIPQAQQGLRRVVERRAGGSRFLLLTSRLGRLVPALRSRLLPVPFRPLSDSALGTLVDRVARAEEMRFSGSGRAVLLFHSRGSPERALHLVQAAHLAAGGRPLEAADVQRAASSWEADFAPLTRASYADARGLLDRLLARGLAPEGLLERFAAHLAASPISEEEKASWAVAIAGADPRLREGLRGRTQLQGLWEPPVTPRPPEPAPAPSRPGPVSRQSPKDR